MSVVCVCSACLQCVSVVRLIIATRSSGPPASGNIIKEMPGSVASGTPYINHTVRCVRQCYLSVLRIGFIGYL